MFSTGWKEKTEGAPFSFSEQEGRTTKPGVQWANVGLMFALFVLGVLSVSVAVTNERAAVRAQRQADVAELSELALVAVLEEEDAVDEVLGRDDDETRRAYETSMLRAAKAIAAFARADPDSIASRRADALHVDYGEAVQEMFERFAGAPSRASAAESFEDAHVDPYFDPLVDVLTDERRENDDEAHLALLSIRRSQQMLLVATPALFAASLALLTLFVVKLGRSRSELTSQVQRSHYQSLHDGLTGLPNRTLLHRLSSDAVAHAADSGTRVALMMLDVDRFKEINDTLGHHSGDLVLGAVATRLRSAVRASDTVARLGGDEFAILLPHVADAAAAREMAARVQAALEESVDVGGIELDVDASIGIALSGEHGNDVATLLQHADIAMYQAKAHSLGIAVYREAQNHHNREDLRLVGGLRAALDNHELLLHFQPKIELDNGAFCGAEALVRWQHPTRGLVPPAAFIPSAERTAMIRTLTNYVIDAALAECQRWNESGKELRLAVNVSARNLLDRHFVDDVVTRLGKWGVPPSCLLLEITEKAMMLEPAEAENTLARIADLGIELAIDDFGAGNASLARLRTLPVHEIKIDQSLVAQMQGCAKGALLVRAVIDLAHNFGLRVVAEGVEDAATLERLTLMGCDIAQGYHIARSMTAHELTGWCIQRETPAFSCPAMD